LYSLAVDFENDGTGQLTTDVLLFLNLIIFCALAGGFVKTARAHFHFRVDL